MNSGAELGELIDWESFQIGWIKLLEWSNWVRLGKCRYKEPTENHLSLTPLLDLNSNMGEKIICAIVSTFVMVSIDLISCRWRTSNSWGADRPYIHHQATAFSCSSLSAGFDHQVLAEDSPTQQQLQFRVCSSFGRRKHRVQSVGIHFPTRPPNTVTATLGRIMDASQAWPFSLPRKFTTYILFRNWMNWLNGKHHSCFVPIFVSESVNWLSSQTQTFLGTFDLSLNEKDQMFCVFYSCILIPFKYPSSNILA